MDAISNFGANEFRVFWKNYLYNTVHGIPYPINIELGDKRANPVSSCGLAEANSPRVSDVTVDQLLI